MEVSTLTCTRQPTAVATCETPSSVTTGKGDPQVVETWPLERVVARVRRELGWDEAFAALVEREYRRFMTLCATYPGNQLSPSPLVDEVWHRHILFTKDYAAFGLATVGGFIHHSPYDETFRRSGGLDRTCTLYGQHFGEEPTEQVWARRKSADCGCDDCAGFIAAEPCDDEGCGIQAAEAGHNRPTSTAADCDAGCSEDCGDD